MKSPTVDELNKLIDAIKGTYRLPEKDIMSRAGYSSEYLYQTKSRGKVSAKLISALVRTFPEAGAVEPAPNDTSAVLAVLVEKVAYLMSKSTGRSSQIERELIERDAEQLKKIRKA